MEPACHAETASHEGIIDVEETYQRGILFLEKGAIQL